MKPKKTKEQLKKACKEAIYHWNMYEGYYHHHSAKIGRRIKLQTINSENWLRFYHDKIFQAFLRQYSVRRNLVADRNGSDPTGFLLLNELGNLGFFQSVAEGDRSVIDATNRHLKSHTELVPYVNQKKKNKGRRNSLSLLGKTAFLINPTEFSLYDRLAKEALIKVISDIRKSVENQSDFCKLVTRKNLDSSYEEFLNCSDSLIDFLDTNYKFSDIRIRTLKPFMNTHAGEFFSNNDLCYRRRVVDKFLWIYTYEGETRGVHNESILNFRNGMTASSSFSK